MGYLSLPIRTLRNNSILFYRVQLENLYFRNVSCMGAYQIREGKPQTGYYTDEVITKEEYQTMDDYQLMKKHKRRMRTWQAEDQAN